MFHFYVISMALPTSSYEAQHISNMLAWHCRQRRKNHVKGKDNQQWNQSTFIIFRLSFMRRRWIDSTSIHQPRHNLAASFFRSFPPLVSLSVQSKCIHKTATNSKSKSVDATQKNALYFVAGTINQADISVMRSAYLFLQRTKTPHGKTGQEKRNA